MPASTTKYTAEDLEQIAGLMPWTLADLAMQIGGCSPAVARRRIVARVGSVRSDETFDPPIASRKLRRSGRR